MVKVFACGDIVNYKNHDGLVCSDELSRVVKSADYAVCNFEAPLKGFGMPQPKSGPHHTQHPQTLKGLKEQGFDLALLANNHMLDYGEEGLAKVIEIAQGLGLDTLGAGLDEDEAYRPLIKDINGMSIGIINACEAQFGVIDYFERGKAAGYAWINHANIDKLVIELKEKCDFVLVFSHAGLENYPIPQKEWRFRYKHLCDLGADAVIAAHPHVPQGYEKHNNSHIFYSLGNFYFDGGLWANSENTSYSIILYLEKNEPIQFELVYHYTTENKVHLAPEHKKVNVDNLCNLLNEGYTEAHDEMTRKAYTSVKASFVRSLFSFPIGMSLKATTKEIVATLLGRRRHINKPLTLMHLLRNEAYYYVMRHALEIETKTKEKLKNE
ncbi:CapA family protein [Vibrio cincinnatiensis]|uniref:CapA family protein n=1 Tax=Vibrio cincinnatiensis TaxID=675 RepID=UPI001EDCB6A6|nr:CapA family protein [Vibrio cincinnatiensis]MCG3741552.1 CapA family protein [Vibrio cincinnatiensis]